MLTLKEKYIDFLGNEREEDVHFHISETDLIKMQTEIPGGYTAYAEKIIASKDTVELMKVFESIIKRAYGVLSADGTCFDKSPENYARFVGTPIYNNIFLRLVQDADFAADFFSKVIPASLSEEVKKNNPEIFENVTNK